MFDFLLGNDFLSAIAAFIIVLIPAVIIHEFGHFLAAKAVGITVLEFGVGFPPRAAKLFTWGETEFTLNWLPLGGFVRPLGEDMIRPLSEEETEKERQKLLDKLTTTPPVDGDRETVPTQPDYLSEREELAMRGITEVRSINEVKPLQRIFFMSAGALANFLSALVIFIIIGLLGVAQPSGARVYLVDLDPASSLAAAGMQTNDYIETINGEKFDTTREFFRVLSASAGTEVTVTLRRESETQPVTLTFVPTAEDAAALANATGQLTILAAQPNSPAAEAGLLADDIIVSFAGVDLTAQEEPFVSLQGLSLANQGKDTPIKVNRGGEMLSFTLTPRLDPPAGVGRIGVELNVQYVADTLAYGDGPKQQDYIPLSLTDSIQFGVSRTQEILMTIVEFPVRLIRGETQPEENRVISIVGVSQLGGVILQESIQEDRPIVILNYMALISIALGFTNLLPIPALDGGRILFVLIEMIRGKPISQEREGIIRLVGLALLLSLGIFVILNDLLNPVMLP